MKKIIAISLALITVFSLAAMAVGCSGPNDDTPSDVTTANGNVSSDVTTEPSENTEVTTGAEVDENGYLKDQLPDDLKYDGKTFNLLVSESQWHLSFADENDGTFLGEALYERQATVEDRLGLDIVLVKRPGGYSDAASFCNDIYIANNTNMKIYDLAATYNLVPPLVAQMGLAHNLVEE